MKKLLLIIIASLLAQTYVNAEQKTWLGAKSFSYSNAQNWKPEGVPTEDDDLIIPKNSPKCSIENIKVAVRSVTVEGTLNLDGCDFAVSRVANNNTITIGKKGAKIIKRAEMSFDMKNNGIIQGIDAELCIYGGTARTGEGYESKLENNGTIELRKFICKVKDIVNKDMIIGNEIAINDFSFLDNTGSIKGKDANNDKGGSVLLFGYDIMNKGQILGGRGTGNNPGGSITINGIGKFSHHGLIQGGNGGTDGDGGYISINGWRQFLISGSIYTGYDKGGPGEINLKKDNPEAYAFKMAGLSVKADSIDFFPYDSIVWAGTIELRAQKMTFDYLEASPNMVGFDGIDMYSSSTGIVDFFNVVTEAAVVSIYDSIKIYSNIVVQPPKGLNHVCNPNPIIFPSENTIVDAQVFTGSGYVFAKPKDSLQVFFNNFSTMPRDVQLNVTSSKGWVHPQTKTARIEPFLFEKFNAYFKIPPNTPLGVTDTVKSIVTINTRILDTFYSVIYCHGIKIPSPPTLISPSNASSDISINPELEWLRTEADSFLVQLATDKDFNDKIQDEFTTELKLIPKETLQFETKYYWRIKSVLYTIESEWSSVWNFTTEAIRTPDAPELVFPQNKAEGIPKETELLWNPASRAESYHVQLALTADFTNVVFDSAGVKEAKASVSKLLLPNTLYYWRVSGENQSGEGSWSNIWYFRTGNFTSAEDYSFNNNVSIFPNPAGNYALLQFELEDVSNIEIKIINLYSEELITKNFGNFTKGIHSVEIPLNSLSQGSYIMRLAIGKAIITKRLVLIK